MALLPVLAQIDQFQNFPADCQMRCDGRECASKPTMVDPPAHYPSLWPTISILHMFPKRGSLHEFFVVELLRSHTTLSFCQWWYFHHLVLLYHLILPIAWVGELLLLQFPDLIEQRHVVKL